MKSTVPLFSTNFHLDFLQTRVTLKQHLRPLRQTALQRHRNGSSVNHGGWSALSSTTAVHDHQYAFCPKLTPKQGLLHGAASSRERFLCPRLVSGKCVVLPSQGPPGRLKGIWMGSDSPDTYHRPGVEPAVRPHNGTQTVGVQ